MALLKPVLKKILLLQVYPHKLHNFLSTSERDFVTVMVGGSTEDSDDSYSLVDPSHSCSISLDPLPVHNMWDPIVAVVQDQMVACYIDYEHYITWGTKKSLCWQLRVDTRSRWTPVPSPPQGMFLTTSAVVGEKLLVIGGSLQYTYDIKNMSGTTLVQEYDIRSRTWAEGTRLPAPLFEGCAVETLLGVIVIGDFEAGNPNAYILDRSKWKPLPLSNYAHTNPGCALVTINRKSGVLVISGSFVEFFSLWDNKWIKLPGTKVKRKRDIRPTVGMSHGQIVITGGFDMDSGEVSDIIEVWDGEEWMWRVASKRVKGNRIRQGDVSLPKQYAYNCYKDYTYKINDKP